MKRTDSEIQQAVLRELKWDTRVEETDVGVEVDAGVVTLTGTVSSWAKRMAAQEAAHRVGGVLDVANDNFLRRFTMPDDADESKVDATFNDGMLNVVIGRSKAKASKAKEIAVH